MTKSKNTFGNSKFKVVWSRKDEVWKVKTVGGRFIKSYKLKSAARKYILNN